MWKGYTIVVFDDSQDICVEIGQLPAAGTIPAVGGGRNSVGGRCGWEGLAGAAWWRARENRAESAARPGDVQGDEADVLVPLARAPDAGVLPEVAALDGHGR